MVHGNEQKVKPVPFYTKVGWVVAWAVMLIIIMMILRNCVTSVKYGTKTKISTVEALYQLGIKDGRLGHDFFLPADVVENPVLRKSYNKGYREGLDVRHSASKEIVTK